MKFIQEDWVFTSGHQKMFNNLRLLHITIKFGITLAPDLKVQYPANKKKPNSGDTFFKYDSKFSFSC